MLAVKTIFLCIWVTLNDTMLNGSLSVITLSDFKTRSVKPNIVLRSSLHGRHHITLRSFSDCITGFFFFWYRQGRIIFFSYWKHFLGISWKWMYFLFNWPDYFFQSIAISPNRNWSVDEEQMDYGSWIRYTLMDRPERVSVREFDSQRIFFTSV